MNELARRLYDIPGPELAFQVGLVPDHDLRRQEADHTDPYRMALTGIVDHLPIEQDAGRQVGVRSGGAFQDIGADEREVGTRERNVEEILSFLFF